MNMSFYTAAIGAHHSTERLSVVSNNLANVNNTGFKPKTAVFSELINYNLNDSPDAVTELQAGASMKIDRTNTSFDVAAVTQTNSEFDYAIMQSNAFFMLQDPATGAITYTRDGHFHRGEINGEFFLTAENGKLVMDQEGKPLKLDVVDVEALRASMEEEEETYDSNNEYDEETEEIKPTVGIFTFNNPSRLMSVGDNEFVHADADEQPILVKEPAIQQYALENSGTDMAKEMVNMIESQRAFSYAVKMIMTSDEITQTINSLRG